MPNDLSKFGTSEYPLHPSGLRALLVCPWRTVVNFLGTADGESGQAADTGSAMHAAAAAFHRGADVGDSLAAMKGGVAEYALADMVDAANLFLAYAGDPRNRDARCVLVEHPISFCIAPADHDPTGAPIQVDGTCDQVREAEGGGYILGDIKSSKRDPNDVLMESTFQAAAYMVGASIVLGKRVDRAMIIMPRKYGKDLASSPVFWHFPWRLKDTEQLLEPIRDTVAAIRLGRIHHMPNSDCKYCVMRSPQHCLPELQKYALALRGAT